MSFKHNHSLSPILALEFYHTTNGRLFILAAEGSVLKIFDAESSRIVTQCRVFQEQAIHGIAARNSGDDVDDLEVVIWGGPNLTLLRKSDISRLLHRDVTSIAEMAALANDWILSVAFSPWKQESCVMITAHNAMLQASVSEKLLLGTTLIEQLQPPSRSMLYSASLVPENADVVIVAAGTIFGEVIVWKCVAPREGSIFMSEVLFILTGHEGSIFGVDISPLILDSHGKPMRLLASCSDDRTIRVWDITGAQQRDAATEELIKDLMPRETGFGGNSSSGHATNPFNRCIAVTMGHASRIWGVKFNYQGNSQPQVSSSITILSFGEDSTTQQWALQLGPDTHAGNKNTSILEIEVSKLNSHGSAKLTHIKTFAFHSGKHIFGAAVARLKAGCNLLATGGADGKISAYIVGERATKISGLNVQVQMDSSDQLGITGNDVEGSSQSSAFDLEEVLRSLPSARSYIEEDVDQKGSKKKNSIKDAFNRYAFVSEDVFLVTTNDGKVLKAEIGDSTRFTQLDLPPSKSQDLRSYSALKGLPSMGICFLAGSSGTLFLYRLGSSIEEIGRVDRKPSDIFIVSHGAGGTLELLVHLVGSQLLLVFPVLPTSGNSYVLGESKTLTLHPRFVVTGAGRCGAILVLGSRNGHIAIHDDRYDSLSTWGREQTGTIDAITSIIPIPNTNEDAKQVNSFVTTSRNGTYSIFSYSVAEDSNTPMISCVHCASPPFGPMIESCWFQGSDLILYGFKSTSLVVWNETKQSEVMRIECGGAHRAHAYSPLKAENAGGSGHLVYTKASKLYLHSYNLPSHRVMKPGGHGREIKACAILHGHNLIATGAEDTNIRLWRYNESGLGEFECRTVIQKHTAGIQHLQWHGPSYLFSSGGVEEFYVWAIQDIPGFGIGVVCEASCPDPTEEQDLRIMGFDVSNVPAVLVKESTFLISLAYSDSTMRTYSYCKARGFKLMARGQYTAACLTKIKHLHVTDTGFHILTAATDGSLCTWYTQLNTLADPNAQVQEFSLLSYKKVHQNAVKTLDVATIYAGKCIVVASGGDDNALAITIYEARGSLTVFEAKPETIILRSAHAAAITGLSFIIGSKGEEGSLSIVSSSTDQRVKTWRVNFRLSGERDEDICPISFEMVGDEFTSVSDIGDLAVLDEGKGKKAIIVGQGMDVWSFEE
ncbi:WD repeat-containing protein 6 [Clarireedia jacksonii]